MAVAWTRQVAAEMERIIRFRETLNMEVIGHGAGEEWAVFHEMRM